MSTILDQWPTHPTKHLGMLGQVVAIAPTPSCYIISLPRGDAVLVWLHSVTHIFHRSFRQFLEAVCTIGNSTPGDIQSGASQHRERSRLQAVFDARWLFSISAFSGKNTGWRSTLAVAAAKGRQRQHQAPVPASAKFVPAWMPLFQQSLLQLLLCWKRPSQEIIGIRRPLTFLAISHMCFLVIASCVVQHLLTSTPMPQQRKQRAHPCASFEDSQDLSNQRR